MTILDSLPPKSNTHSDRNQMCSVCVTKCTGWRSGPIRWINSGHCPRMLWKLPENSPNSYVLKPQLRSFQRLEPGPGSSLKALISLFGISPSKSCRCGDYARLMDSKGPAWCVQNVRSIAHILGEEAQARGLPYDEVVGMALVLLATVHAWLTSRHS